MSGRKLPPRVSSNDSSFMSPTRSSPRSSPISLLGAPSKPRGAGAGVSVSAMGNTAGHLIFSPKKGNQSHERRSNILNAKKALKRRNRLSAKAVEFAKNREKMSELADRKAIRMATRGLRWADNRVGKARYKGSGKVGSKVVHKRAVKMAKKGIDRLGQGN